MSLLLDVYMELPQNFKKESNKSHVLKLNRAIYGLKQSARAWYKRIDDYLHELEYQRSVYE